MKTPHLILTLCAAAVAATLAACGGGGGSSSTSETPAPASSSGTATAASSGAISAFGSVFVNGHEFSTNSASLIDDDTGASSTSMSSLEVGMTVDVKPASHSTASAPIASEVHVHPLARGYVDASDSSASTLTVMGQTVELSSSTLFVDRRACLSTSPATCTAITGQSALSATTGSGSAAAAGTYASVHGYLFSSGAGASNIVATLISVSDAPATATAAAFKAEGVVSSVGSSSVVIGGLNVDLGSASCLVSGAVTPCASAFAVGNTVSAFASTAPSLPASTLTATKARLATKLAVETAGAVLELEGKVSSVTSSPAAFVIRGVTVDATGLPAGTMLPSVGDQVKVVGTVSSNGTKLTATSLTVLGANHLQRYGFESDFTSVAAGSTSGTYTLTLMGQTVRVDSTTRLADHSASSNGKLSNPFNINTFQTYLDASTSKHLQVRAVADSSGALSAQAITVMPARSVVAIAGAIDATPAPVNGSGSTATTFSVHGLPISAAPAAVVRKLRGATTSVAAGDLVLVRGTYASGTLTVAAPSTSNPNEFQIVIDRGTPSRDDEDLF
jgi:hypothetical protein